jgi:O-antigen ligase
VIERCYGTILTVLAIALFYTNATNYLYQGGGLPIEPYWWIIGYSLLLLPLILRATVNAGIHVPPLAIWAYGFGLISIAWFFRVSTLPRAVEELETRLMSIVFILIMLFIFSTRTAQTRARQAIAAAVLLGVGFNLYELFNPQTFSNVLGRSAGLYINPNQSGNALVLGMILGLGTVAERYRLVFMVTIGLGVLITFSRSALLAWTIAFLLVCAVDLLLNRRIRGLAEVAVAGLVAAAVFLSPGWTAVQARLEDEHVLNDDVLGRVSAIGIGQFDDDSATERGEVATRAWDTFGADPLLGSGTGASISPPFDVGPHNTYLALMVDHGLLGLILFPALILACTWRVAPPDRTLAMTFSIVVATLGLFSHNLLSERYALITYALIASIVLTSRQKSETASVRTR